MIMGERATKAIVAFDVLALYVSVIWIAAGGIVLLLAPGFWKSNWTKCKPKDASISEH